MKSKTFRAAISAIVVTLPTLVVFSNHSFAAPVSAAATGAWDVGTTWSNTLPAAAGNDYTIDGFTVTSPTGSNTVTFPGDSISISKTGATAGVLDLARLHASTEQIITTTLPPVTINSGATLQFRASTGSNRWNLGTSPIAVSGTVLFNNTGGSFAQNINLSGPVTGSGLIEYKTANSGSSTTERTLTLNSANSTYSGNWFIQHVNSGDDQGTLAAGAANALGTGIVTLDTRARLRNNANNGFDSLTGITSNQSTASIFFNGRDWTSPTAVLTMTNGAANVGTAHLNIASLSQAAGTISLTVGGSKDGKLITSGNANFTGGSIVVGYGANPSGDSFDLVTYGGSLVTPPTVNTGDLGRLVPTVTTGTGTNDKVTLSVSGSVANLVWTGATNDNWDNNATQNFTNGGSPDVFRTFDNVLFNDTPDFNNPLLVGNLTAGTVTFNNSLKNYTLAGAGTLAGTTALVKAGTGSLTISNTTASTFTGGISISGGTVSINSAQNYTGNISITGGKLMLGNASAIGATGSRTVSATGGGQFDFNGFSPGTSHAHTYRISGDGGGTGALVNSSATSVGANSGIQNLELLGNATIGGAGRFDIARVGTTSGTITGNSHTLTKTGANQINLRGDASSLTIIVNEGILGLEDSNLAFGGATGSVTVNNTAVLGVWGARTVATPVTLNAGTTLRALGGAAATWSGPITLGGNATIEGSGANVMNLSGSLAETGGSHTLEIRNTSTTAGSYTFTLSNSSTRTGPTTLTGSIFKVQNNTALGSGAVTIQGNGTTGVVTRLDLSGVTVANNINLSSNAQTGFFGPVTAVDGLTSTVSGVLNVTSGVGNGGHFASSGAGSVLRITGTINSTGTLPNIRQGTIEMGTTGGNLTSLAQGEGTLRLVANNGIQSTVELRMALSGGGTLDLNGFNQTLAQIKRNVPDHTTGTSQAATVTNTAGTPSVLTIDGAVNHQFSGIINNGTGGIALVKNGASVWTLSGINTYTGTTTVNGGTLRINSSHAAATGNVTVNSGGTLGGTSIVGGAVTVKNGGALAPGASVGTLTANAAVTLEPGAAFTAEIDSSSPSADQLFANAAVTITGAVLNLTDIAVFPAPITAGTKLTLIDYGPNPLTGTFSGLAEGAAVSVGFNNFTISYVDSNKVTLTSTGSTDPFIIWAASKGLDGSPGKEAGFDDDPDGDGVDNGLEWILGGQPLDGNSSGLVTATSGSGLTLTFDRNEDAIGQAALTVEYNGTLANPWNSANVGPTSSPADGNGVTVTINTAATPDEVIVNIPASNAAGGKLFGRLKATKP